MSEMRNKYYCDRCSLEIDEVTRFKISEQYKNGSVREYEDYHFCDKCLILFRYDVMDKFLLNPLKMDYALMATKTVWDPGDILIEHEIIKRILKEKLYKYESMEDWGISPKDIWEVLEVDGTLIPEDMKKDFMDQWKKFHNLK